MAHPGELTTRTARLWIEPEGILRGEALRGAKPTLADAQEQLQHQRTLASGRRPFLMDIRQAEALTREARTFFAGDEAAQVFSATALLIDSPLSRAIGNF